MAHEESTGVASSSNNENTSPGTDTGVTLNSLREMLQQLRTDLTKSVFNYTFRYRILKVNLAL